MKTRTSPRGRRAGAGIRRRLASHAERLEPRLLLTGDVVIAEFLASNSGGAGSLLDQDGDSSDWIELQNFAEDSVNVGGWYLTDDAANLTKWQLPARDILPGGRLVVFASGKDRTGAQLHTNFQLDQAGEYLALVMPNGTTVSSEYAPSFPNQVTDISYGILDVLRTEHPLVTEASQVNFLSPDDDSLGTSWTSPDYDDSAWPLDSRGAQGVQPVGFDADYVGAGPGPYITSAVRGGTSANPAPILVQGALGEDVLAYSDRTHQYNGVDAVNTIASLGLTGADYVRVANDDRAVANYSLTLTFNGTVDLYLFIDDRVGDNVNSTPPTLGGAVMPWVAAMGFVDTGLNIGIDGNGDGIGPGGSIQDFASIYKKSGVSGNIVLDTQNDGTSRNMYGVAAFRASSGPTIFIDRIHTNVQARMYPDHASAYLRSSFGFSGGGDLEELKLSAKYDDGFVAYLNGTEIARRNAPGAPGTPPAYNAAATGSRPDTSAIVFEAIDVTSFGSLLLTNDPNVLAIQALNEAAGDADFFLSAELRATTSVSSGAAQFFTTPTPGAANVPGVLGFVADTKFDGQVGVFHDAGFYNAPFDVTLSTTTLGAQIRYTTDGSAPTATTGTAYSGPIPISGTTKLRVAAFKSGYQSTNVDTQTYIFPNQVLTQSGTGLPAFAAWGHAGADWQVDPDVVNHATVSNRLTTGDLTSAVPTLSLVANWNDLFGSGGQGIYIQGAGVERAMSLELINPDGSDGFSVNGSVEIQGGTSDDRWKDDKLSMQLKFHRPYGPTKLNYPLFGDDASDSFDTIILDGVLNWSWVHTTDSNQRARAKYIQDQFVADLQNATGGFAPHGRYMHLYLNGLYWGMYYVHERPDKTFNSDYQGGDKDEWNVIKHNATTIVDNALNNPPGTTASTDYNSVVTLANADLSIDANYQAVAAKLDVENFIDYLLVNWYAGNDDWPAKNWYTSRQAAPDGKWRFHSWDAEHVLKDVNVNRVGQSPSSLHTRLALNAGYRLLFADHVQRHMFSGGILTPARAAAMYQARMTEIDAAIRGESARWGDNSEAIPKTRADWLTTQNQLLTSYFPQRTGIVLGQLRTAGLYPSIDGPVLSQPGGLVPPGFPLTITDTNNPPGNIYYTTDGSEPSAPATYIDTTLSPAFSPARAFVPSATNGGSTLGTAWIQPGFNDSAWASGNGGVGYDTNTAINYLPLIGINVQTEMLNLLTSVYYRTKFNVANPGAFTVLTLKMKYDDGFVAYLNGFQVASSFAPATLAWNSASLGGNSDAAAIVFQSFDISQYLNRLVSGENVLAIHGLNASTASSDMLIHPELVGSAVSGGGLGATAQLYTGPVLLTETSTIKARIRRGTVWSALSEAFFTVETPVRVTEVNYHPGTRSAAEIAAGFLDDDDFEFVEIQNVSNVHSVDLSGAQFVDGLQFTFGSLTLAPGQHAVVVRNQAAYEFRYGTSSTVAGTYGGTPDNIKLSNNGETITLQDAGGGIVQSFAYDDDWYLNTDGLGQTLVIVDPLGPTANWNLAPAWRPSCLDGGSPGAADPSLAGRAFDDADADGVRESGESGHGAVPVTLYNAGGDGQFGGGDDTVAQSTVTASTGVYRFFNVPSGTYYLQFTAPAAHTFSPQDQGANDLLDSDANAAGRTALFTLATGQADGTHDAGLVHAPASVVGRQIFYNNSGWDGNDAAANATDDAAIATDKTALLPGGTATLANYTSYNKGINGIMVDIAGLSGVPTAADFTFRTGNVSDTNTWTVLATAPSVLVRPGAGTSGSARVMLTWLDNTVVKKWLQVIVLANGNTGLPANDVFYFGNAVGESGNAAGDAQVNAADELAARGNPRNIANPAPITFLYDYNRDKQVNAADQLVSRGNPTNLATRLVLISPTVAPALLDKPAVTPAPAGAGLAEAVLGDGELAEAVDALALRRRSR